MTPQYSIGKNSIVKESIEDKGEQVATSSVKRFVKPTLEEIAAYCEERKTVFQLNNLWIFTNLKAGKLETNQ